MSAKARHARRLEFSMPQRTELSHLIAVARTADVDTGACSSWLNAGGAQPYYRSDLSNRQAHL